MYANVCRLLLCTEMPLKDKIIKQYHTGKSAVITFSTLQKSSTDKTLILKFDELKFQHHTAYYFTISTQYN